MLSKLWEKITGGAERHMKHWRIYILTAFAMLAALDSAYCRDLKFEVSIDKAKVALGEAAQLARPVVVDEES